jgi:hypothetical protein
MGEHVNIRTQDIEIEHTAAGPIIHIFPPGTLDEALHDIIQGLYLNDFSSSLIAECDTYLKKELPDYLIMSFTHLKKELEKTMHKAEEFSNQYVKQINDEANKEIKKNTK